MGLESDGVEWLASLSIRFTLGKNYPEKVKLSLYLVMKTWLSGKVVEGCRKVDGPYS
jgi:hypothetical protein